MVAASAKSIGTPAFVVVSTKKVPVLATAAGFTILLIVMVLAAVVAEPAPPRVHVMT